MEVSLKAIYFKIEGQGYLGAFLNVFHRAYTDVVPSDTPPTQRALIVNKAGLPTLYSRSKLFALQGMDAPNRVR